MALIRDKNLVLNEYYHIYNRGNGKHKIFLDDEDYDRFEKLLYLCNGEQRFNFRNSVVRDKIDAFDFERGIPLVSVLAWVLMPNHFHIILISSTLPTSPRRGLGEVDVKEYYLNNPITKFIHKLLTSYAMYFNKKYKRTGGLFEGVFKSRHIGDENYFNYIFSYVHLNPLKLLRSDWKEKGITNTDEATEFLKKYKYSSFQDYFGLKRRQGKIIDKNSVPEYFLCNQVKDLFKWIMADIQDA